MLFTAILKLEIVQQLENSLKQAFEDTLLVAYGRAVPKITCAAGRPWSQAAGEVFKRATEALVTACGRPPTILDTAANTMDLHCL